MLKKIFKYIIIGLLGFTVQATAATATIDLVDLFDTNTGSHFFPEYDGEIHFGDNWLTHPNLDYFQQKQPVRPFKLSEKPEPGGTVTIFMAYSAVDLSGNYFSINDYDFSFIEPGGTTITWTVGVDELGLKEKGSNTFKFHLDSQWLKGWGRDIEDFDITEFSLTYDTFPPNTGGGDPVPLPTAALLLGTGLIGMVGFRRRQR